MLDRSSLIVCIHKSVGSSVVHLFSGQSTFANTTLNFRKQPHSVQNPALNLSQDLQISDRSFALSTLTNNGGSGVLILLLIHYCDDLVFRLGFEIFFVPESSIA